MIKTQSYKELFGGNLKLAVSNGAKILSEYPDSKKTLLHIAGNLKASDKKRRLILKEGIEVPPLFIINTTQECNLRCAGCYSCELKKGEKNQELTDERKVSVLNEASDLGAGIVMLAGGEPLLSKGWLESLSAHRELLGIVFTNGTLFNAGRVDWFSANRHIIPTFSIEGDAAQTDKRRGAGVYAAVEKSMYDLKTAGIPFGVSITATQENLSTVCSDGFIKANVDKGCRLFIFVEYVPVEKGTEPLMLSLNQKKSLQAFCKASAKVHRAFMLPFPGDEEQYGGCLAAGRGFIHIGNDGALEPCPFAPFSDSNLKNTGLKEALSSPLMHKIRENHHLLKEGEGGCALWHNRDWLKDLTAHSEKPQE